MATILKSSSVLMTALLLTFVMQGCGGLARTKLIKHPDTTMVIIDGSGSAKVSVWDHQERRLVEYGKVRIKDLSGWTLHRFDWSAVERTPDK
jgi:hypothetical protein